jgi:hypothetical protein
MSRNVFTEYDPTNVNVTTTNETVVCTLPGVSTGRKSTVFLEGWLQFTTGANTTALTARIRRGTTIAGTLVCEATAQELAAAAGGDEEISINGEDPGVDLSGATYVLTIQATAASADGTALQSKLEASVGR